MLIQLDQICWLDPRDVAAVTVHKTRSLRFAEAGEIVISLRNGQAINLTPDASFDEAKHIAEQIVAKLNTEGTENARRLVEENPA